MYHTILLCHVGFKTKLSVYKHKFCQLNVDVFRRMGFSFV